MLVDYIDILITGIKNYERLNKKQVSIVNRLRKSWLEIETDNNKFNKIKLAIGKG